MSAVQSPMSVLQRDIQEILNAPSEVTVGAKARTIETLIRTTQEECPQLSKPLQEIFNSSMQRLADQLAQEVISDSQSSPENLMARYQEQIRQIRVVPAPLLAQVKEKIANHLRTNLRNSLDKLSAITRQACSADQQVADIKKGLHREYSPARQVVERLPELRIAPIDEVPYRTRRDTETALTALRRLHSVADESVVQLAGLPNLEPLRAAIPAVFRARRLPLRHFYFHLLSENRSHQLYRFAFHFLIREM